MNFFKTIKIAMDALMRNKMRTFLTMLGIIIGVGAVIGMLGIAKGMQHSITSTIESIGTDGIFVMASSTTKGGVRGGWGSITTLKVKDSEAIQKDCPHIRYSSPMIGTSGRAIYKSGNWSCQMIGVNEYYQYIGNWKMAKGAFFTNQEVNSAAKVCVLGQVVVDNLYTPEDEVLNSIVRINKIPFRVIGVLASKGSSGGDNDQDDIIVIPYTTMMQRIYKENHIPMIMASATSREDVTEATEEVTTLLRQRHRIKTGEDDDFQIQTLEEILEMVKGFTNTFKILLGSIASISLLVGGIGIMNIMLVSVTERIREIGIRMALGARPRDILGQFLIESIVLSAFGGIMGVGLGYLIAYIISKKATWPVIVSADSITLALSFALGVGIFFGFFPAWKASKLDPIQALRHE